MILVRFKDFSSMIGWRPNKRYEKLPPAVQQAHAGGSCSAISNLQLA
jgi:hypothetical protein